MKTKILNFRPKSLKPGKSAHSINPELKLIKKDDEECPKCGRKVIGYLDLQTKICYNCRETWDE